MGLTNHPDSKYNYDLGAPATYPICLERPCELAYIDYAIMNGQDVTILLCSYCAHQLARKILEDLCDLLGNRSG